jgi:hypothetical protein
MRPKNSNVNKPTLESKEVIPNNIITSKKRSPTRETKLPTIPLLIEETPLVKA